MNGQSMTKWILVSGLSKYSLPKEVLWASKAIGRALARKGYGLIVGPYPGVDYVVAEEFTKEVEATGRRVSDYLIQIVPEGRQPDFKGEFVIYVHPRMEWKEKECVFQSTHSIPCCVN